LNLATTMNVDRRESNSTPAKKRESLPSSLNDFPQLNQIWLSVFPAKLYTLSTLRHVGVMATPEIFNWLLALGIGYLAGSIPFGLLLARAFGQGDIREIGSGNIGATNVLRTGRKDIAAITLLLDAAKAGLTGWLVQNWLGLPFGYVAAAAALIGHCYPIWLKFKGGKGVATFFGGLFALVWPIGIIAALVWLATALITRYSSLGALIACIISTITAIIFMPQGAGVMVGVMAAVILWRHRENMARLRNGEESKIGQKG